jgi:dihydrofolate synthase/folylpolyglutamate synthase
MGFSFSDPPAYEDVVRFFECLIDYERGRHSRFREETRETDLERFRRLLDDLGSPQFCAPTFHVAGTKGKGSVCAFLASILGKVGLRVGLYTSPHIENYCERIRVNDANISDQELAHLIAALAPKVEKNFSAKGEGFRTVFELLTAAGFVYFSRQGVDVLVVETGLGGRLDATNVFAQQRRNFDVPHVSVITSIGYDHMEILGDTIEKISAEKAGIIHHQASVVVGAQAPLYRDAVRKVIENRAAKVGCHRVFYAEELVESAFVPELTSLSEVTHGAGEFVLTKEGQRHFSSTSLGQQLAKGIRLKVGLPGLHQLENLRTTLVALLAAEQLGMGRVSTAALMAGSRDVRWPGRFEILSREPVVVVDGAHCELSTMAMAKTYRQLWGNQSVHVVLGLMQDKALSRILAATRGLLPASRYYCCTPPSPRGRPAAEVAAEVKETLGVEAEAYDSPQEAVTAAWQSARREGAGVIAFGSFYLVAPYKRILARLLQDS